MAIYAGQVARTKSRKQMENECNPILQTEFEIHRERFRLWEEELRLNAHKVQAWYWPWRPGTLYYCWEFPGATWSLVCTWKLVHLLLDCAIRSTIEVRDVFRIIEKDICMMWSAVSSVRLGPQWGWCDVVRNQRINARCVPHNKTSVWRNEKVLCDLVCETVKICVTVIPRLCVTVIPQWTKNVWLWFQIDGLWD